MVSQVMHNLGEQYMNVVMRVLWYLKGSPRKSILFAKNRYLKVEDYTDAGWA